jgi:hypothetical protein
MTQGANAKIREVIFVSKATPGDDEFVLWLGRRLEAAGYWSREMWVINGLNCGRDLGKERRVLTLCGSARRRIG